MTEVGFDFQKFLKDIKNTLINPRKHFASISQEGGLGESIIKTLLYGLIAGIISFIWSTLELTVVSVVFGHLFSSASAIGIMAGLTTLIYTIVLAVIILFAGSLIMLVISAICGGNTNYELNVKVTASLMVLMPINELFGVTYWFYFYLGCIFSLLLGIYGIWLLFNSLITTLEAKKRPAKVVSVVLVLFPTLILLGTIIFATGAKFGARYMENKTNKRDKKIYQQMLKKEEKMKIYKKIREELEKELKINSKNI